MNTAILLNQPSILEKVIPIIRDILDNEDLVLTPEMTAADVDGWDSLAHIRIMIAIEDAFTIRFTGGEVSAIQNVKELIALIDRKQSNG